MPKEIVTDCCEYKIETNTLFVDFRTAFDTIN